jgi:hypothetical protein
MSTPQCPTHYTPDGRCDVLDIVVHQNVRLSEFNVSYILEPIAYQSFRIIWELGETLDPVEKSDWERLHSRASEVILLEQKLILLKKLIRQMATLQRH